MSRLDTLIANGLCDTPDFVKLDVQGFEYEVLQGFGEYLDNVLCVEMESQFTEMYSGQKTFNEVNEYMIGTGFQLRHLEPAIWPRLINETEIDVVTKMNILCTYSQNKQSREKNKDVGAYNWNME